MENEIKNQTIFVVCGTDSQMHLIEKCIPTIKLVYGTSVDIGVATFGNSTIPPSVKLKKFSEENGYIFHDSERQHFLELEEGIADETQPSESTATTKVFHCHEMTAFMTVSKYYYDLGYTEVFLFHSDLFIIRDFLPLYRKHMDYNWAFVSQYVTQPGVAKPSLDLIDPSTISENGLAAEPGKRLVWVRCATAIMIINKVLIKTLFSKYGDQEGVYNAVLKNYSMYADIALFQMATKGIEYFLGNPIVEETMVDYAHTKDITMEKILVNKNLTHLHGKRIFSECSEDIDSIIKLAQAISNFSSSHRLGKKPQAVAAAPKKDSPKEEKSKTGVTVKNSKIKILDFDGDDHHYFGWKKITNFLKDSIVSYQEKPVLVDMSFEKHWVYDRNNFVKMNEQCMNNPWIAFAHHPHDDLRDHGCGPLHMAGIVKDNVNFKKALKNLKGIFTTTETQAKEYRKIEELSNVPVSCIPHPYPPEGMLKTFSLEDFKESKNIITLGFHMRENEVLNEFRAEGYNKIFLKDAPREEYEKLLTNSVVFQKYKNCAASNTIGECISSCTPVLVNKLPAIVEYLGEEYPLYYSSKEEAESKIENLVDLAEKTHQYLLKLKKKKPLTVESFVQKIYTSEVYKGLFK